MTAGAKTTSDQSKTDTQEFKFRNKGLRVEDCMDRLTLSKL